MTSTWIEVSKEAFIHNVNQLKKLLGSVKLGFVVKSNGYGHGLGPMAQLAEQVDALACLFTSNTQEALLARKSGFTKPLCVLAYYNSPLEEVLAQNIDLVCYSDEMLEQVSSAAQETGIVARIHLKIDTGMGRLGIKPYEVESFLKKIAATKQVKLVGMMSHCADSGHPESSFTAQQVALFNQLVKKAQQTMPVLTANLEWIHCCSSGSFLASQGAGQSVVRVGSNLYGCWKSKRQKELLMSLDQQFNLRQIMTIKSRIIALKTIAAGHPIGYSCTFYADQAMKVALLPVGYADGYPRALSNRGHVEIDGKKCPVVGIVSMGLVAIDVSRLATINVGDIVVLSTDRPGMRIDDWAEQTGMLNLDILAHVHPDLTRIVVG